MKKFKVRSSSIGDIMPLPRAKKDIANNKLSKTAEGVVISFIINKKYDRNKQLYSKYLDKGIRVEEESIEMFTEFEGGVVYDKNEEYKENEYISGTPDIITDEIIDIKSNWNLESFLKIYYSREIDEGYYWQLQAYMWLFNKQKARLVYCLVNTPRDLINREINLELRKRGIEQDEEEKVARITNEIINNLTFDDIPLKERIRVFEIERDEDLFISKRAMGDEKTASDVIKTRVEYMRGSELVQSLTHDRI